MDKETKDYIDRTAALIVILVLILALKVNNLAVKVDNVGNLVPDTIPIPNLAGKTGASPVLIYTAAAETSAGTFVNTDGTTALIASLKGIFSAGFAAMTASTTMVIPNGGTAVVTGLSGTGAVAWAHGDVLYAAPDGTLGTLTSIRAIGGNIGKETAKIGVISDDGSGILTLSVQPSSIGITI